MATIIRATPLYGFLKACDASPLEKVVLDCGAGGDCPPLIIFHEQGYRVYGVEISEDQLRLAADFCAKNGVDLHIKKGDMRQLDFADETFSFVYSYNTIFHLTKADTCLALQEMERLLPKGGLCFVNFLSVNDGGFGAGEPIGDGEFIQSEGGEQVVHTYYKTGEPGKYFSDFELLRQEERNIEFYQDGTRYRTAYFDYTLKKK